MNTGYLEFLLICTLSLLTGIGLPLPVSIPPLPEEPALLAMAPKHSIAFLSWSGTAEASAQSPNRTERLCAEPEVRALITKLRSATLQMLGNELNGPAAGLAQRSLDLVLTMFEHPGCLFISEMKYDPRPQLTAGIAVKLDRQLGAVRGVMGALELTMRGMLSGNPELHDDMDVGDVTFHAMPVDTDHGFLGWTTVDGWFLLAAGKDAPAQMIAGLRGTSQGLKEHPEFDRLQSRCSVARPSTRAFLDLQRLYDILKATSGDRILQANEVLGLGQATAALSTAGLEGDGYCYRLQLAVPEHEGLLSAFGGQPLRQDDLLRIPRDADLALSVRLDAGKLEDGMLELFSSLFAPGARAEYEREFVGGFAEIMGLDWRADVLDHVGDQLTVWNAPSQGGALFTAAVGILSLEDAGALAASVRTMTDKLEELGPARAKAEHLAAGQRLRRNSDHIETFDHQGHHVWWLDILDDDMLFAPAWSVTEEHLLVSMVPQSLRSALDSNIAPNPDESLMRSTRYNKRGKATGLFHLDMRRIVETGYPALLLLLQSAGSEWQREGFDFDLADVPRASALLPHLGSELTLLEPNADGWALTRTGSLPVADPLLVLLVAGLLGNMSEL